MYLYGAGGHAKVIRDIVEAMGDTFTGIIDDNLNVKSFMDVDVKHTLEDVDEVIVCIGYNKIRKLVAEKVMAAGVGFGTAIHPSAVISKYACVNTGTVVMQGAIINSCARIGKHCIINTGASVDHECVIEDFVHISPHATLCGNVIIGEGTWIGAGAVIIPGVKVGKWSAIGAGSVVIKDIPDGVVAYGNPCIVKRKVEK